MKISEWPSTHVNLVTGWAAFTITIIVGWIALLWKLSIDMTLYTTLLVTTGAWAGVATPAALMLKRATTKPEMTVSVTESGPPQTKTTVTELTPKQAEAEEPTVATIKPLPPKGYPLEGE